MSFGTAGPLFGTFATTARLDVTGVSFVTVTTALLLTNSRQMLASLAATVCPGIGRCLGTGVVAYAMLAFNCILLTFLLRLDSLASLSVCLLIHYYLTRLCVTLYIIMRVVPCYIH